MRRALDQIISGVPLRVDYEHLVISDINAGIGPFGDEGATVGGFGADITWDEARRLASHPYVEDISSLPDGTAVTVEAPDCNLNTPIEEVACTDEREPIDGKFSAMDEQRWNDAQQPTEVVIQVRGGAPGCPLPACPARSEPCPERAKIIERMQTLNDAPQGCVRALVEQLGGVITQDQSFALISAFTALLTWDQIEILAAYPGVAYIESAQTDTPPG